MEQSVITCEMQALQRDITKAKSKSSQLSIIRLFMIIMIVFSLYQGYNNYFAYYIPAVLLIISFLIIAKQHMKLKRKIEEKETLCDVYEDIVKRKGDGWKTFENCGEGFLQETMTQAYDLDIFGKASLFQYLNTATTVYGEATLADWLSMSETDYEHVMLRQNAVKECLKETEFSLAMMKNSKLYHKHAKKMKKKKLEAFLAYMEDTSQRPAGYKVVIAYVLPVIVMLCTLLAGLSILHVTFALAAFTITLAVGMLFFIGNNSQLSEVENVSEIMRDYEQMFAMLESSSLQSDYLKQQQTVIQDALQGINRLNRILAFVKIRSNSILFLFVNGFLLMDFHCVLALYHWKVQYGKHVKDWLIALGKVEAIVSLTQIAMAKQTYCFGEWQQNELKISSQDVLHPLLNEEKAIANSIELTASTYVITGSNMSGKTTFLRTIGVNLVLFLAGAPVCAKQWSACDMQLYTSMRVHDNVSEGISTFYAEILRIKQMMDAAKQNVPMLVLIDEIFKGTNSADRILCAMEAIKRLHLPHVITMVSTHDFELCDLERDAAIQAENYHFSEYYDEDNICFDYLLKQGRCLTTNARQLMKLAGF